MTTQILPPLTEELLKLKERGRTLLHQERTLTENRLTTRRLKLCEKVQMDLWELRGWVDATTLDPAEKKTATVLIRIPGHDPLAARYEWIEQPGYWSRTVFHRGRCDQGQAAWWAVCGTEEPYLVAVTADDLGAALVLAEQAREEQP